MHRYSEPTMVSPPGSPSSIPEVRAVARTLQVLNCFTEEEPRRSLAELARLTDLPKSTVYRLLLTLERYGVIERTGSDRFQLGTRLIELGQVALNSRDLVQMALAPMRALRDRFGESVHLHLLQGAERVCIYTAQSPHDLRTVGRIGERSPLHAGASARVILAFLPEDEQRSILQGPLQRLTDETITDAARLARELEAIRRRGFATSTGERNAGIVSAAAPLFHAEGIHGSISISGPASRIPPPTLNAMAKAVQTAANTISRQLGHHPSN